jgi:hypothetical protein
VMVMVVVSDPCSTKTNLYFFSFFFITYFSPQRS